MQSGRGLFGMAHSRKDGCYFLSLSWSPEWEGAAGGGGGGAAHVQNGDQDGRG